jgi:hypothetical protein
MKTVVILGWNSGFQKVKFTNFLRHDFGYSLSNAKAATDAVLDNQRLGLQVQECEFDRILAELSGLGAKFVLEEQIESSQ